MNGRITSLTPDWRGDTLVAPVAATDIVLEVSDTADFEEDTADGSYWLTIADSDPIEYVEVDEDAGTVTLLDVVGAEFEAGDPVVIWDPSVPPAGASVVEYVASVETDRGPVDAVIDHETIPTAGVDGLVGASVTLTEDTYGTPYVDKILGREPVLDGALIGEGSIPGAALNLDDLPVLPTTDGVAPDNAPTVTPIGGIGSMFFRWTEITNADPVTYRLHVRAGSAPTTDGTYEVVAGVGLTSASVRKLKDGTAIVGDGSVTYHAVVTVEDADGPGPASAAVTGVPAQVNTADIAANAITAGMLTANDVLADAINATDFTGVTMTAPLIRTVASGRRVELNGPSNWLSYYSGSGSEQLPGYMEADVVGNFAQLVIAAPDTDEADKAQVTYRNMILMYEDVTDASANRISRTITARTSHFFIETAGGDLIHFDGSGGTPTLDLAGGNLHNFTAMAGGVGTGTFRDSVDERVSAVAPTVTMTTGDVGIGAFRDSVRSALIGDYAAGAWATDWTPTWTGATTNPAIGNGTLVGRYICLGKTVHFYIEMTAGSTTTFGTGLWTFDLPVTEVARRFTVTGHALDTSSNDQYPIVAIRAASDTLNVRCDPVTAGAALRGVAFNQPFTWATGDVLHISGTYERA